MRNYRSKLPQRLALVWERLAARERALIVQHGGLPAGAVMVPFENFTHEQLAQIATGMRALASLGDECRFALGYRRESSPASKRSRTSAASRTEAEVK